MAVKPAIKIDTATTLTFEPPEGTPTGTPTVVLYDETGTEYSTPTVTISGANLTCTVPAALVDQAAENYRASWTYTVGSKTYEGRDQWFDCVPCIAYQTLTAANFLSKYWPATAAREFPTARFDTLRAAAWEELEALVKAAGKNINRIVDSRTLEPTHAHLTAATIARNLDPDPESRWGRFAAQAAQLAQQKLDALLANCEYETGDDMKLGSGEQQVNIGRLRMVR